MAEATVKPAAPDLDRFMRVAEVVEVAGLSRASIYRRMRDGTFPLARDLGGGCVRWRQSEVLAWAEGRPSVALTPPAREGGG